MPSAAVASGALHSSFICFVTVKETELLVSSFDITLAVTAMLCFLLRDGGALMSFETHVLGLLSHCNLIGPGSTGSASLE